MRIEPARPSDAARLATIMGDWVRETAWMPVVHTRDQDLAHCQALIARFTVTVGRAFGRAQGFLARDGAMVLALYLAPKARRRGLGRRLLDHARQQTGRLELWCFAANTDALRFYAHLGLVEVERTDGAGNDEKLPDIRLIWPPSADKEAP
ncbi:MAG: GNAT family N-acetyltransferase [Pseudomonadota bacterium]